MLVYDIKAAQEDAERTVADPAYTLNVCDNDSAVCVLWHKKINQLVVRSPRSRQVVGVARFGVSHVCGFSGCAAVASSGGLRRWRHTCHVPPQEQPQWCPPGCHSSTQKVRRNDDGVAAAARWRGGGGGGVAHSGCAICFRCLCMRQALGCGPCQPEHWHSAHSSRAAHVQDGPPPPACVCAQGSGALPHPRTAASEWAGQQDGLRGPAGKEQELCAVCAPKQDRQRVSMYV